MNRCRLSPDERCEELLDAAEELFQTRSVDDVTMKDIAKHAGVTRALLYHYYPTKADLFGAIWSRAHERVRARPAPSAPTVREWLEHLLRNYLDFYAANVPLVAASNRSTISTADAVHALVNENFRAISRAALDAAGAAGAASRSPRSSMSGSRPTRMSR